MTVSPRVHRTPHQLVCQSVFPARPKQITRLAERRESPTIHATVCGIRFDVFPGVYQTSVDTALMSSVVRLSGRETLLEVGCGCGAVTLTLARKCRFAHGVDVNPRAVENARHNASSLAIMNAAFSLSDVFDAVNGRFDVIVCNPPYNQVRAADTVEKMFWDPNDDAKIRFFAQVRDYLRETSRVYFGWANFADLDSTLPLRLAGQNGLRYVRHYSAAAPNGPYCFYVIELRPE